MSLDRRSFLTASAAVAGGALAACAAEDKPATTADSADADSADAERRIDPKQPGKSCKTKFAVNVEMWFRKLPFLDRVRAAAALGFPAVEMWPYQGKDIDALAALTKELGISISQFTAWGFTPGMNEPKNHDLVEKTIREACGVAKKLGVKKMCVVGGNDVRGMTQDEMHEQIIVALKRVKPIAEDAQVMLILEPMNIRVDHKGHCLYGSPKAVKICREVDSPMVKINWDLYHMHISEGDLCGHLREGWDQVGYLQMADHPGRNEPGTGEIHYNRVLKEIWALGYRDYVGLECSPKDGERKAAMGVALADVW
ncbi:MAG: TIM barrel protein [Pirellulales bacterium]